MEMREGEAWENARNLCAVVVTVAASFFLRDGEGDRAGGHNTTWQHMSRGIDISPFFFYFLLLLCPLWLRLAVREPHLAGWRHESICDEMKVHGIRWVGWVMVSARISWTFKNKTGRMFEKQSLEQETEYIYIFQWSWVSDCASL